MKPKGVTTQMKALDENFLKMHILNSAHVLQKCVISMQ